MREIKFRVINGKIISVYEYLGHNCWEHRLLNTGEKHQGPFNDPSFGHIKACIRNQFIGLKDSKDKEIYEGDVLEFMGELWVCVYFERYAAFMLQKGNDLMNITTQETIVGNIYENPELLQL